MSTTTTTTTDHILQAETFTVYKDALAAMTARYGTGFVKNLPDKTGFSMQWFSKRDARDALVKVFITPSGVIRIEFSRNLGHGICNDLPAAAAAKTEMALTGLGTVILFNNPEDSFIHGKIAVRQSGQWFSSANCKLIVIGLLEKVLQG